MSTRTAVELDRAGVPLRVFHRSGQRSWTHPPDAPVLVDGGSRAPCPVCSKKAKAP